MEDGNVIAIPLDRVLEDVRRSSGPQPRVTYESWSTDPRQVTAMLYDTDGSGSGVSIMLGDSDAENLARLADQVQEWCIEARWSRGSNTNWPPCPHHPASHPLSARASGDRAVWVCPGDGAHVAEVGRLGSGSR